MLNSYAVFGWNHEQMMKQYINSFCSSLPWSLFSLLKHTSFCFVLWFVWFFFQDLRVRFPRRETNSRGYYIEKHIVGTCSSFLSTALNADSYNCLLKNSCKREVIPASIWKINSSFKNNDLSVQLSIPSCSSKCQYLDNL